MLLNLHVKNMALIQEEEINFGPGLNILTGETGAGKSIVIGSVNVALGNGSFRDYVPEQADYALVELLFSVDTKEISDLLAKLEIPAEEDQIIISRKYQNGRSISRVNGETVNISVIKELASHLIDIHGQHQHQSLLYPKNHLLILDNYAGEELTQLKKECSAQWQKCHDLKRKLEQASLDQAARTKEIDFLQYEIQEIEEAGLRPGEDEEAEKIYERMSHGQKIIEALSAAKQFIGYENGAGELIGRAVKDLNAVAEYDENLTNISQEIVQVEDLLNDLNRSISDYMDDFSYDEQEFYELTKRLDLMNHLKSKYGKTIDAVLTYQKEKQERLYELENYDVFLSGLQTDYEASVRLLSQTAQKIFKIRKKCAGPLEQKIIKSLQELNFLDVKFSIDFQQLQEPNPQGLDEVCFLISMNPGMPLRPMQEVASGGELSRIMLALKAVMAQQDSIGSLIFDEIDTGISGRTAQKVSEKMAVIAQSHQVICITHLAQIAAMADVHFSIEKHAEDNHTITSVRQLSESESIEELARILGGVSITEAVYQNAREMKLLAETIKREDC